jgi:outer membrane receptor protein involved in Fe transport
LKFITARPNLSQFGGFVEVAGSAMEEGEPGYDLQGAVNIPLIEDKLSLRIAGKQSKQGGFVDNISGSSADTHDWAPAFESDSVLAAYPDGLGGPSGIPHVTKTNHDVAEDDVGDIDIDVLRLTAAWQMNDAWLATGMVNFQSMHADGVASWEPEHGDLNQIRFKDESRDDDWYVATLVFEGDLGFADFTSATGYMERESVYNLDQSTYLHQFQGIGGVIYNSFDIAYFPAYNLTVSYASYAGSITDWSFVGTSYYDYNVYLIEEITDNTGTFRNDQDDERFAQEFRLTSKDEGQRFQWMLGGFYEKFESSYVFRGRVDNFGDAITGQIIENLTGIVVRSPGTSWWGTGVTERTEWAVFAELGFNITDNLNILVGARYFDAESDISNQTLSGDGTTTQNCAEDSEGNCRLSASNLTADNRIGTFPSRSAATNSDTLPLLTVTWSLSDDVLTYFTRSEGFRVGGTNIVRAISTAPTEFDPDKVINYELGLKTTLWDGRFVWNISAYQMTWEEMQLVAADPTIDFGWGQVTVNTGEAEIEGFETNFALAASERWRFDGAFSYTSSEVTEGASKMDLRRRIRLPGREQ